MLRAVLFDMDGVIVDTEPLHRKAYHQMFNEVSIDVKEDLYASFTGQSTINICKRLVDHFSLSETPEYLVSLKRKHYNSIFENDDLQLIDGVLDRIKDYHANNVTLVVASSASMPGIQQIFNYFDLNQYFSAKFSGADLKKSKPHPEIFLKAAEFTGFKKSECMVIEDSTNGIKAAHAAGIFCAGYKSKHSSGQDYTLANMVVSDFEEISYSKIVNIIS
ncbi:HAD family phosphatase [Winogradskyella litoriviva]|uniref:HAD family phosphatase n=1 Tax=Winogradskyella litoriviva TaxID=1220182 RepID=A0ABX2E1X8_9FLAO|nr:HAD family phosphatase [Winogradskyella litoriviva]NRD22490.1 HAD family phosphatase [Winogradskyella litoriviva]